MTGLSEVLVVHAEDGVAHVQPPRQVCRHPLKYLRDQDRHLVLDPALDGDAEAARLPRLADQDLPPSRGNIIGDGDVGVALGCDDVDVIVQGNAQVRSLQGYTIQKYMMKFR